MKIHTCSQDGDPWAWNQINRWWFQILNAENIRFRPGIDKNCQSSKNVKKLVSTDLADFESWRKSLVVQKSNQVQIPGLRFYVLTVMMCFNSPLTDFYHTSTTRIEPLNHLWEYFLAECQKLEILFSICTDFLKSNFKTFEGIITS